MAGYKPVSTTEADDSLRRVHLFGLELIDCENLAPVVDVILAHEPATTECDRLPVVVTPNVDILVDLDRRPDTVAAALFRRARLVLPDGMPLVFSSRLLGRPLAGRLTGSGLFEELWPRLASDGRPAVVLCASHEIVRQLEALHPEARFVVPPMLDIGDRAATEAVVAQIDDEVVACDAHYVLLGLGHPKDATIIMGLVERWTEMSRPMPLCLGLGGSFAMFAGLKKRAPAWMQRAGLEWFYRFVQEPRRLFRRYFIRDVAFVGIVRREHRRVGVRS
ncbi:MAG: WecB/TagA/CpsF family glycosyltransferase [Acidimicrobiales bacterium]